MTGGNRGLRIVGKVLVALVLGVALTLLLAVFPALTRDDPWSMTTEDSREREGVESSAVALTGKDAWANVAIVWIDVAASDVLVSMREQEVRSLTGIEKWAALPPIVESNKQYRAIATGAPFKCLAGCGISNDTDPSAFASTFNLARPIWNAKVRSVPTGVLPTEFAINTLIWSAIAGLLLFARPRKKPIAAPA